MLMRDFYCTVNCLFIMCTHTSRIHYNLTLVFIRFLVKGIDDVALYSKAREILIIMGEYFQIQDDYLGKQKRESERRRSRESYEKERRKWRSGEKGEGKEKRTKVKGKERERGGEERYQECK